MSKANMHITIMRISSPLRYFWLFFVIGILVGCRSEEEKEDALNAKKIYIQPDDTSSILSSKVFDDVEYIPLQTSKESMIGKISKLEVTDDLFFIMDNVTNSLLLFNKSGEFLRKINGIENGKDTIFANIVDFTIDKLKNEIVILDSYRQRLTRVNFKGEKISDSPTFESIYNYFIHGKYRYVYKNYARTKKNADFNLIVYNDEQAHANKALNKPPMTNKI